MIYIRKITVRNFMSYGNVPTIFELTRAVSTLIVGGNGHGKSVLADALCFVLYGKPYRKIKLGQLINSINAKHSVVTCEFTVDGNEYKVVRGQKPKVFEIFKNDVLVEEEAAVRDYQKYLETQVLKIAFKTFCQIVVMGSSNFVPFMSLEAAPRRDVIEDVLDISLFSVMNDLLKERVKTNKTETNLIETKIESAKKETTTQQKVIGILQEATDTRIAEETAEIERIQTLRSEVESKRDRLKKMFEKFPGVPEFEPEVLGKQTRTLSQVEYDMEKIVTRVETIHRLTDCPTCMQIVTSDHKSSIKEKLMDEHAAFEVTKNELNSLVEKLQLEQSEFLRLSELERKYNAEITRFNDSIIAYGKEIETHQATINRVGDNRGNIDDERRKLNEIAAEALLIIRRRNELLEEKSLQDISAILLKDTGIKAEIIKEYVPILNKLLNRYLSLFGLDVNFYLDENFNETVKSRGRDEFTYNSFSEGEKRKIDIAILFAFRKVTELKNSATCNLLLMDEIVDSSLEPSAREIFLDILRLEGGNNIVISHTTPNVDIFDEVIEVKKIGDFSTYEYIS